jgi:DNA (cytosine-5)-methyltransferase 1
MNHIELFAGCGGLSLGLEQCGFEITLANELSPMAAESFAYNFFDENLEKLASENSQPNHALWINSRFPDLKSRLRENPFSFPAYASEGYSDLPENNQDLEGKLLVGSIIELNKLLDDKPELASLLNSSFGKKGGLDLVSGGPPCQSFSMAGLRQRDSEKNSLPWEFAKFVQKTQPKIALLENVTGILRPFKDAEGNAYHAWYEVAKVFASIGYIPLCLHINARFVGVAQNRPRFIMLAVRKNHFDIISKTFEIDSANNQLFSQSEIFYEKVQELGDETPFGHLKYFDVTKAPDREIMQNSFLSSLVGSKTVTVHEAIDDLRVNSSEEPLKSGFINTLNSTFEGLPKRENLNNHDLRNNGDVVKRRFRLYQVLAAIDNRPVTTAIFAILKGNTDKLPEHVWPICGDYDFLQTDGSLKAFKNEKAFIQYLQAHPTKKQTQKALIASSPAPAALSIPDDGCHYDENELRVLTVREMARIQSFPDDFVFRSKVTTGGKMRRFEVPQYTQVGNAVPPLLGLKLGQCVEKLLVSE